MADLILTPSFDPVYQLETTDLALAGAGGIMNDQAQALGNRDEYLKYLVEGSAFAKVQHTYFAVGGGTPPFAFTAANRGTICIQQLGSIGGVYQLPDITTVPDGTTYGIVVSNIPFQAYAVARVFGTDTIEDQMNRGNLGISPDYFIFDGGRLFTKHGAHWEVTACWGTFEPGTIVMIKTLSGSFGGWLECNGMAVPLVTYPALYGKIGFTFGGGGGFFNLPTIASGIPNVKFYIHV